MSEERSSLVDLDYRVDRAIGFYDHMVQKPEPYVATAVNHIRDATRPVRDLIERGIGYRGTGHVGPLLVRRPRRFTRRKSVLRAVDPQAGPNLTFLSGETGAEIYLEIRRQMRAFLKESV